MGFASHTCEESSGKVGECKVTIHSKGGIINRASGEQITPTLQKATIIAFDNENRGKM